MLAEHGRLAFDRPILRWVQTALAHERVQEAPLTAEAAVEAALLPGDTFPGDPADRFIIATAIAHSATHCICGDVMAILARLSETSLALGPLDEIGDVITQLNKNLDLIWLAWSDGIAATGQKKRAISETLAAYHQFGEIWRPRFADLRSAA